MTEIGYMIGNWVAFENYKLGIRGFGRITALNPVRGNEFLETVNIEYTNEKGKCLFVGCRIEGLKPIPLTTEILQKNFPDYEPGYTIGWWPNDVGFRIEWSCDIEDNEIILKHVMYVHQLQNMLKMIKYNKEVEL